MCLEAIFPSVVNDSMAFASSADPDTMYLHETMNEPDRHGFIKAMQHEMNAQLDGRNCFLILRSQVPKGYHHPASSLANEAQTMHSNKGGLQMEGKAQHQWVLPGQGV